MTLIKELKAYKYSTNSIITIGVFDGVHRGHQKLISKVVEESKNNRLIPLAITFINHPVSVLTKNVTTQFIYPISKRVKLLEDLAIKQVIPITFDKEVANLSAKHFIQLLQDILKMKKIIIGPDFTMGHNKSGTNTTLPKLGSEMGFSVLSMQSVHDSSNYQISSTAIRQKIKSGNLESANLQLGRSFSLEGTVVKGMGRGRTLGYPTANLQTTTMDIVIPGDGIYATKTLVDETSYLSATSIGTQPTFGENTRTIESHLINFSKNLYNKRISIQFEKRIRDQKHFASVIELQKQISKDIEETQKIFYT